MSFPARFGTYEVFRIILPGFYCLGLLCLTAYLLPLTRNFFVRFAEHQTFLPVVTAGGVFVGFFLYAIDYPKKIRAYKRLEKPSDYLKKILCDECQSPCVNKIKDRGEAIDTYFYLLLEKFKGPTQERIFYIGSVYHVFADIRMLSALFSIILFLISLCGVLFGDLPIPDAVFGLFTGTFLGVFWLSQHPEFFSENKSKGDRYEEYIMKMQKRIIDLKIDNIREDICRPRIRQVKGKTALPLHRMDGS